MEVTASIGFVRMSPRKLRLVAAALSGLSLSEAEEKLRFLPKAAARPIASVLHSAGANAVTNNHAERSKLLVKMVRVGEGPRLKRQDRSHSMRAERGLIQKGSANITAILSF